MIEFEHRCPWNTENRKIIDLCKKKLFNLFTVDLFIYFPTSNKMAIIGTLPSRFSDRNQELYKGSQILYEHAHKNYLYFRPR